jgi:hypothetical protein
MIRTDEEMEGNEPSARALPTDEEPVETTLQYDDDWLDEPSDQNPGGEMISEGSPVPDSGDIAVESAPTMEETTEATEIDSFDDSNLRGEEVEIEEGVVQFAAAPPRRTRGRSASQSGRGGASRRSPQVSQEAPMPRGRAPRRASVTTGGGRRAVTTRRASPTGMTIESRPNAGDGRRTRPVYSQDQQDTIVRNATQRITLGESPLDIAKSAGVSYPTLLRWLKRSGYQTGRGGRRPRNAAVSRPATRSVTRAAAAEPRSTPVRSASSNGSVRFDLGAFISMNEEAILEAMLADRPQQIRNAIRDLLKV